MDSKITNETNSDTQSRRPSLVVATMGTDGGIAKTTSANHLSDFYDEQGIPIARINCDVEKLQRGSFSSFHKDAINADIRTPAGADIFVDTVLRSPSRIVLVDMAANLGKFSLGWFDEMYEPMHQAGVQFLFVGVVTSSPGSVQAVLRWASVLGPRVRYMIFENAKDGDDFSYLHETPQGKAFLEKAKPPIISVRKQLLNIQAELDNRGLTLRQALVATNDRRGPILSEMTSKMRIEGRYKEIRFQLMPVKEILLP